MQVEVRGWDIHAVSAPGRRAPPATPGRVARWRTTAAAPAGQPGRAAARPHDTNAASTGTGAVYRPTAPPGECVLTWNSGTAHSPRTGDLPEQTYGFPAAESEPAIAAAELMR